MEPQIIIQGTTFEALVNRFDEKQEARFLELKKSLQTNEANNDLMSRSETCELLKINASTLWHWTNKGKVLVYGISNRRYYKRSEIMEALTLLKK